MKRMIFSAKKRGSWLSWTIILLALLLSIVLISAYSIKRSFSFGLETTMDSFNENYQSAEESTYSTYYEVAAKEAEKDNHASNRGTINIDNVKKELKLKALTVSDVVFSDRESSETVSGTATCVKVTGEGSFTVDLTPAEFVVDNRREYVLVRVPKPVLSPDDIRIDAVETMWFSENKLNSNNSVKTGAQLAYDQIAEAKELIMDDLSGNEQFSKIAEKYAGTMITTMMKTFNPEIPDITIKVEFF